MFSNFSKLCLVVLSFTSAALGVATRSPLSTAAVIPISGNKMSAITPIAGVTWFFYQETGNNSIIAVQISNALAAGGVISGEELYVPGSEVKPNSPIAVSSSISAAGNEWVEIHVFFISPENILSEYYYTDGIGLQGGPSCTSCVTNEGFVVASNSQMLYAIETLTEVRVGFVSAGSPTTISEAASSGNGWSVASLT